MALNPDEYTGQYFNPPMNKTHTHSFYYQAYLHHCIMCDYLKWYSLHLTCQLIGKCFELFFVLHLNEKMIALKQD